MGMGYLRVETGTASDALPVASAEVRIKNEGGELLGTLTTNANGVTDTVALDAPDASHTLSPDDAGPYYATYIVEVQAPGYEPVVVAGVQVFDTEESILPVELVPASRGAFPREIVIPENQLHTACAGSREAPAEEQPALRRTVIIPEEITVHLGAPASSARDVRVRFADYIKNVASSEIYPTWPDAALEANIYCQISFALNRVYTEWYPSRGYAFHITSSTAYDQSYVDGRNIFANISALVDNIFNVFIRRQGYAEPFFAQYCNGTTVTCPGLSQWGTVPLANRGMDAYQILRSYYPADIQLVATDAIAGIEESYPGTPLRQGSQGEAVQRMQVYLNRIRVNYPLIPPIQSPNGSFGADTAAAVRMFQGTFALTADGIVGKATWYKIIQIYNAVKKLGEMESEGERIGIGATPPSSVLREGSRGADVVQLQFILNFIGEFYSDIPLVLENSLFDAYTKNAVLAFQRRYGLTADGVVGPATWRQLYEVYHTLEGAVSPPGSGGGGAVHPPYPGVLLKNGSRGESVRLMQQYLNAIYRDAPGYSRLDEDAIFGPRTQSAVISFQIAHGLGVDGIIGPLTWNAIVAAYQKQSHLYSANKATHGLRRLIQ